MFKSIRNRSRDKQRKQSRRAAFVGVEHLGDRVLLTARISTAIPGVLTILADQAGGSVKVDRPDASNFRVTLDDGTASLVSAGGISRIDFQGGPGDDVFENGTDRPASIRGGAGNDILRGGSGNDTILGEAGDDILIDGRGDNQLDGGDGSNAIAGIDSRPMTPARFDAAGDLWAVVEDLGNGTRQLTLSGPSGYGMRLVGDWRTVSTDTSEIFTSNGAPILKTALGDLKLGGPVTITTARDKIAGAGKVTGNSWSAIDFANEQDPNAPMAKLKAQTGISLTMPTVAGWGIKLGRELKEIVEGPWNDAVPYLYVNTTQLQSMRIGSIQTETPAASMGVPQSTLAVDPSDFFLYVGAKNLPLFGVSQFGFGYSSHGVIPLRPFARPDGMTNDFRGHLYIDGRFDMSDDAPLDFGEQGGNPLSFNGQFDLNLNSASGLKNVSDVIRDPAKRGGIAFAANVRSNLSLRLSSPVTTIASLQIGLADGTMVYDPVAQAMKVRVTTRNPLKDIPGIEKTPLASLADYGADVQLTVGKSDFNLGIKSVLPGSDWTITATKASIVATGTAQLDLGFTTVSAWMKGTLNYDGTFRFEGDVADFTLFGYRSNWHVVWTGDGMDLIAGVKSRGVCIQETFVGGLLTTEQYWRDGKQTLRQTWDKARDLVTETWDAAGNDTVIAYKKGVIQSKKVFRNGVQTFEQSFTAGRLTVQRTWDAAGNEAREEWDNAGTYTYSQLDKLGRFVYQSISSKGVLTLRRTWDYVSGRHYLEVYTAGVMTSKQLWTTTGRYVSQLSLIPELWNKFIGLF